MTERLEDRLSFEMLKAKQRAIRDGFPEHVRRQGFWDQWRVELREALAHQVCHSRRLPYDVASAVA